MYVPAAFAQRDPQQLHEFLERHSFATLVSQHAGESVATHLPLLLERSAGVPGTLSGHVARANLQWRNAAEQPVLAIFQGPHAYISPAWYAAENVVPTWNYLAVHAYGRLRVIDDRDRLLSLVTRMVQHYEGGRPTPWALDTQDEAYVSGMLQGIVGFEIEIERLEGQWKLNQHHSVERRARVIQALRESDSPDAVQIADLMDDPLTAI